MSYTTNRRSLRTPTRLRAVRRVDMLTTEALNCVEEALQTMHGQLALPHVGPALERVRKLLTPAWERMATPYDGLMGTVTHYDPG